MELLNPLALVLALFAVPVLLMYMLRLRRKPRPVSSSLLWRVVLEDLQANAPWQRIRHHVLLYLQLAALAFLVLSIARPALSTATGATTGDLVIVLDCSSSMQAADVSPSRFEAARREARSLLTRSPLGQQVTLVFADTHPHMVEAEKANDDKLLAALDAIQPSEGATDWPGALTLAAVASGTSDDAEVVLITDGGLPADLPRLPGDVTLVTVGLSDKNVGHTALALRDSVQGVQAYGRIQNFAATPAEFDVEVLVDGRILDVRSVRLGPHEVTGLSLQDLPSAGRLLETRLVHRTGDYLRLDDTAWAVYPRPVAPRVLLVSRDGVFLERALTAILGRAPDRVAPDALLPDAAYDLYVLDGPISATLPQGQLLVVNPSGRAYQEAGFGRRAEARTVGSLQADAEHSFLAHVSLADVHVVQLAPVDLPPQGHVVLDSDAGPLVFTIQEPERRIAGLAFDLRDSDLPLRVAFPVLVTNMVNWLLPSRGEEGQVDIEPGDLVSLAPSPDTVQVVIVDPGGERHNLSDADDRELVWLADRVGVYYVEHIGADGTVNRRSSTIVNHFAPSESRLTPQRVLSLGGRSIASSAEKQSSRMEIWRWLAAVVLVLLAIEWGIYCFRFPPAGIRLPHRESH